MKNKSRQVRKCLIPVKKDELILMNTGLDIIDRLEAAESYVKLVLKNGQVDYGFTDTVFFNEDDNGWETIKRIYFQSYFSPVMVDYGLEDIETFEPIKREDIPKITNTK